MSDSPTGREGDPFGSPGLFRPAVPAGARCAVHAETDAVAVCTRCGNYACSTCASLGETGDVFCTTCADKAPSGIPWEARKELGFFTALWRTWRESLERPSTFFSRRPTEKAIWPVFAYGLVFRFIAGLGGMAYQLPQLDEQRAQLAANPLPALRDLTWIATPGFQISMLLLSPITVVLWSYMAAGLWWLSLKIVGASPPSFDRVLRALVYTDGVQVFAAIPVVGGFVVLIWSMVLQVVALRSALRTDLWRVVVAGLLLLTFGCVLIFGGAFATALAMMSSVRPP